MNQHARIHRDRRGGPGRVWTLPGFDARAKVATVFGDLPLEALRRRDEIKMPNGTFRRVEWVDLLHLDGAFLGRFPDAQPVCLRARALGQHAPGHDLRLSPAQAVLVPGPGLPGTGRPRSARDLERSHPGALRSPQTALTYVRFHCGVPCLVMVEGLWCPTAPEA